MMPLMAGLAGCFDCDSRIVIEKNQPPHGDPGKLHCKVVA
jgi:hypothetical protein